MDSTRFELVTPSMSTKCATTAPTVHWKQSILKRDGNVKRGAGRMRKLDSLFVGVVYCVVLCPFTKQAGKHFGRQGGG